LHGFYRISYPVAQQSKEVSMRRLILSFASVSVLVCSAAAADLPKNSIQVLIKALQDSHVEVRVAAAEALAQVPDELAAKPLETALVASAEPAEQQALAKALVVIKEKGTFKRLSEALANPQFTWGSGAKAKAVEVVGKVGDKKAIKWLTDLLASEQEPAVHAAAARALGEIGAPPKKEEKK
jgi:HEAT repeat protein